MAAWFFVAPNCFAWLVPDGWLCLWRRRLFPPTLMDIVVFQRHRSQRGLLRPPFIWKSPERRGSVGKVLDSKEGGWGVLLNSSQRHGGVTGRRGCTKYSRGCPITKTRCATTMVRLTVLIICNKAAEEIFDSWTPPFRMTLFTCFSKHTVKPPRR